MPTLKLCSVRNTAKFIPPTSLASSGCNSFQEIPNLNMHRTPARRISALDVLSLLVLAKSRTGDLQTITVLYNPGVLPQ